MVVGQAYSIVFREFMSKVLENCPDKANIEPSVLICTLFEHFHRQLQHDFREGPEHVFISSVLAHGFYEVDDLGLVRKGKRYKLSFPCLRTIIVDLIKGKSRAFHYVVL